MKDERFIHPLAVYDYQNGKISVAFRRRNHMIPCTTRRMKTDRKKFLRICDWRSPISHLPRVNW